MALEGLWLFSPLILRNVSIPAWPSFNSAAGWLADWIGDSSPVEVVPPVVLGHLGGWSLSALAAGT